MQQGTEHHQETDADEERQDVLVDVHIAAVGEAALDGVGDDPRAHDERREGSTDGDWA
jgi:hypothetical protein